MDPAAARRPEAELAVDATSGRTPEQDAILDEALSEALRGQPPLTREEIDAAMRECEAG